MMMNLPKNIHEGLREAETSLAEIAGERTPRYFPKSSHEIARDALVPFRQAVAELEVAIGEEWFAMEDAPLDGASVLLVVNGRVRQASYCGAWGTWLPEGTDYSTIDFETDEVFGIGAALPTMWRYPPLPPTAVPKRLPREIPA